MDAFRAPEACCAGASFGGAYAGDVPVDCAEGGKFVCELAAGSDGKAAVDELVACDAASLGPARDASGAALLAGSVDVASACTMRCAPSSAKAADAEAMNRHPVPIVRIS